MELIPARTRFFAISLARALIDTRRMFALRILSGQLVLVGRTEAGCAPVLRLEAPKADLSVVEGDFVWSNQPLSVHIDNEKSHLPADTVSACAMEATSSPAASGAGKVPLLSPLPFVEGAIGREEVACCAIYARLAELAAYNRCRCGCWCRCGWRRWRTTSECLLIVEQESYSITTSCRIW